MKAAALHGKTIKKAHQVLTYTNCGQRWVLDAIEFTDGSFLRFVVNEGEGNYSVTPIYPARGVLDLSRPAEREERRP